MFTRTVIVQLETETNPGMINGYTDKPATELPKLLPIGSPISRMAQRRCSLDSHHWPITSQFIGHPWSAAVGKVLAKADLYLFIVTHLEHVEEDLNCKCQFTSNYGTIDLPLTMLITTLTHDNKIKRKLRQYRGQLASVTF